MEAEQLRALWRPFVRDVWNTRLSLQQKGVAMTVADLTLEVGKAFVALEKIEELALADWSDRHDAHKRLAELELCGVLRVASMDGLMRVEPLPDSRCWQVTWKWKTKGERERGLAMRRLLLRRSNIDQPMFDSFVEEPSLNEAMAEISREGALNHSQGSALSPLAGLSPNPSMQEGASSLLQRGSGGEATLHKLDLRTQIAQSLGLSSSVGDSPTVGSSPTERVGDSPTRSVGDSPTEGRARTYAREHVKHVVHDMSKHVEHVPCGGVQHVGMVRRMKPIEQLSGFQLEVWGEVQRLFDGEEWGRFVKAWRLRIEDFPRAVQAAIGETRLKQREGKIKASLGGTANDQFVRFKAEIYGGKGGRP